MLGLAYSQTPVPKSTPAPVKAPAKKSALDKVAFEAYVRHLKLFVPAVKLEIAEPVAAPMPGFQEVKVKASMGQQFLNEVYYVSSDGQKIIEGKIYDVNQSPFAADLAKLNPAFQPAMGPPNAPVQIVLFSDFECHYCREEAKALRENLPKAFPSEVRLVFKDMPLEAIHPWAKAAANGGRCVFRQNALTFWEYHDWVFDKQAEIKLESVKTQMIDWAKTKSNLNQEQFAACIDNGGGMRDVERNMTDARALAINSTPVLFVNGRKLAGSVAWAQLKQIIELELEHARKNPAPAVDPKAQDPNCCSLELKPFGSK